MGLSVLLWDQLLGLDGASPCYTLEQGAVVSDGMVQETLTSSVSNFQVHSQSDHPLKYCKPVAFDRIKHWSLLEIIDMVVFRPIAFK